MYICIHNRHVSFVESVYRIYRLLNGGLLRQARDRQQGSGWKRLLVTCNKTVFF